jgi:hypothetical protein
MARSTHGGSRQGAGRPKIGETRVAIRLNDEQLSWVDKQCKLLQMNRSEYMRFIVDKIRSEQ